MGKIGRIPKSLIRRANVYSITKEGGDYSIQYTAGVRSRALASSWRFLLLTPEQTQQVVDLLERLGYTQVEPEEISLTPWRNPRRNSYIDEEGLWHQEGSGPRELSLFVEKHPAGGWTVSGIDYLDGSSIDSIDVRTKKQARSEARSIAAAYREVGYEVQLDVE